MSINSKNKRDTNFRVPFIQLTINTLPDRSFENAMHQQ